MNARRVMLVCGLLLCIAGISCERPQMSIRPELKLSFETMKTSNSIPAEYGELEAVVSDGPHFARMFFEKSDRSIVVVTVNLEDGFVRDQVLVMPRK